jgi:hypothetical protein
MLPISVAAALERHLEIKAQHEQDLTEDLGKCIACAGAGSFECATRVVLVIRLSLLAYCSDPRSGLEKQRRSGGTTLPRALQLAMKNAVRASG